MTHAPIDPRTQARFLVTDECLRLARWLRLMGYDAATAPARPVGNLYRRAFNERRIIVTRNGTVTPGRVARVLALARQDLEGQLGEVLQGVGAATDEGAWFTRCDVCNAPLQDVDKAMVRDRVPPYVYQTQDAFHVCPICDRIYWAATHWQRARAFLKRVAS